MRTVGKLAAKSKRRIFFHRKGEHGSFAWPPRRTFLEEKDHGAWTIPKGLIAFGEPPLEAAKRELRRRQVTLRAARLGPLAMRNSLAQDRACLGSGG
jgi:predicted NUDIX family NTP pyrophosphohydrolase